MSEQRTPPSRPPQGPIGWLLSLTGQLIGLVIGALVLGSISGGRRRGADMFFR